MRKNGSLVRDEEVNDAAWVAARAAGESLLPYYRRTLVSSNQPWQSYM